MTEDSTAVSSKGVGTLVKVKAVLDALRDFGPCNIKTISESVGEPASSTYRLLNNLIKLGWVDKGAKRGEYRLGIGVIRIGGQIESRLDIQNIAHRCFKSEPQSNGTWSLFVRQGLRSVCVQMGFTGVSLLRSPAVGYSLPIGLGAPCDAMLAFMDETRFETLIEHYRYEADAGGLLATFRERSVAMAAEVRARGYSYDVDVTVPGVLTIGAPVFDHNGELRASVCFSGLRRDEEKHIGTKDGPTDAIEALLRVASRISQGLGYTPHEGQE
ncbi:helix-turn-helix domain-containing protein [Bifidobacterium sp. ESL0732]|uniref:IclR family transcriptional regulator n=1 Tax=Bifidobacterium sp. ESL0732 TaxID=2983222 RepID=UPI0023FA4846|nr:helix-turn-helix domain-containing protein [Bifidobacterium sp. ESL0732]WEV64317.1 helix-turn-helix domain-containing protein [Bifidobacterium sp. ESL0732]